uniref:Uncharacterized protein n=1 Tax=Anguilla anguilla TaxID=7936 RepID=A0A0E9V0L2_ANGAN
MSRHGLATNYRPAIAIVRKQASRLHSYRF